MAVINPKINMYIGSGFITCEPKNISNNIAITAIVYFLDMVTSFPQLLHCFEDAELMNNFCNAETHSSWQCGHNCFIYLFVFEQIA